MKIQKFFYKNIDVSFDEKNFLDATSIAKHFDKFVKDYLKTAQTQDYINALAQNLSVGNIILTANDLVVVRQGGAIQGTWLHPKLAVNFARWLSADFAVWCDLKIDELIKNHQNPTALLPQNYAAALRELAESVEREEVLKLENKQQADCIEAMSNYFRAGMTAPQFVKGLNGVNSTQINAFLQKKNWLYRDQRGEWRVTSYARDVYMTEEANEFTPHGCDPIIKYKPTLLKKGAAKLYEWYTKGLLPMKTTWNGKFIQEKVAA